MNSTFWLILKLYAKHIAKLEKEMLKASKELQFEQAARLRDEILRLKAQMLQSG